MPHHATPPGPDGLDRSARSPQPGNRQTPSLAPRSRTGDRAARSAAPRLGSLHGSLATRAVHAGRAPAGGARALTPPICQSTAFAQLDLPAAGDPPLHTYSRATNPTVDALEAALGALEDAPPAVAFASGMAATSTLLLHLLAAGDEVVASDVVYGGTARLLEQVLAPRGVRVTFADTADLVAVDAALRSRPRLLLVETPANPTLRLADLAALGSRTRAAGTLLAVDNTFLTPVLQRPLDLGADVVLASTTKYLEGHNSAVGGAITARDPALLERLRFLRKTLGNTQTPFGAWLTLRGLDTLPLRVRAHARNAQAVAERLASHPAVADLAYPGLLTFPQAELARAQHRDAETGEALHGGIVAFALRGGAAAARRFVRALRLCTLAENLGATRTLLTHPASMTHGDVPPARREATGIGEGLLRLSVGLEHPSDVVADLERALAVSGGEVGRG